MGSPNESTRPVAKLTAKLVFVYRAMRASMSQQQCIYSHPTDKKQDQSIEVFIYLHSRIEVGFFVCVWFIQGGGKSYFIIHHPDISVIDTEVIGQYSNISVYNLEQEGRMLSCHVVG